MDKISSDDVLQNTIYYRLLFLYPETVTKESVFLFRFGPEITCIQVKLDRDFSLKTSINNGTVFCSVSDGTVLLCQKEWQREDYRIAMGWIEGYIEGYLQ